MENNNEALLLEIRALHRKHKALSKEASEEVKTFRENGLDTFGFISEEMKKINTVFKNTQITQVNFISQNRKWLNFDGYSLVDMMDSIENLKDGKEKLADIFSNEEIIELISKLSGIKGEYTITKSQDKIQKIVDKNIDIINLVSHQLTKSLGVFAKSLDVVLSFISSGTYILESGVIKSLSNFDEILTMCNNILERTSDFEFRVRNNELVTDSQIQNEKQWINTQLTAISNTASVEETQSKNWIEARDGLNDMLKNSTELISNEIKEYPKLIKKLFSGHEKINKNREGIKEIYNNIEIVFDKILELELGNAEMRSIFRTYHTKKKINFKIYDETVKQIFDEVEVISTEHNQVKDIIDEYSKTLLTEVVDNITSKLDEFSKKSIDINKEAVEIIERVKKIKV